MRKSSKRFPWENVFAWWLDILPEDWGELLFRLNLIICKLFFTHSCSSVSENDIMINRNSTSEKILFVYPTSKGMDISIFPVLISHCYPCTLFIFQNIILGGNRTFSTTVGKNISGGDTVFYD